MEKFNFKFEGKKIGHFLIMIKIINKSRKISLKVFEKEIKIIIVFFYIYIAMLKLLKEGNLLFYL